MINKNYYLPLSFNNIIKIFTISIIFFLVRWGASFYFLNEDLITKILFESVSDGSFYYPLIKFLSNAEFTNSLNPFIEDIQSAAIPFGSLIIHTLFYKIFGLFGLILVDLLGIFLFLLIFYKIFLFFNKKQNALFYSLFLFGLPLFLDYFFTNFNELPFIQFKHFFTLRVHRPFPSSLYFFSFILLILHMSQNNFFEKKYFAFAGFLMALSLSSFYYFFIIEVIILFFYVILTHKKKVLSVLFKHFPSIMSLFIIFFLTSLPFLINMMLAEKDVMTSAGVFQLTKEKRFILLNYYFIKLFNLKFLFLNFIILITFYLINKFKINYYKIINIFFLIYISSLVAPFLLLFFSSKIGHMYHFNDNIVIYGILFLFITSIIILQSKINIKLNFYYLLIFLLFINILQTIDDKKNLDLNRSEFYEVVKLINSTNHNINDSSLLTFDSRFMIWAVLSDKVKYLNLTMVGLTGKNHDIIENDLINSFKFLDLNSKDFLLFLQNKKRGYRFLNTYVGIFFRHKYTANSLFTYNDSKNFDHKIKDFILNSSPLYAQQIAIPVEEFSRLENKFNQNKIKDFIKPKIIILNNDLPFLKKVNLNKDTYCNVFNGAKYILFLSKDENTNCDNFKLILSN